MVLVGINSAQYREAHDSLINVLMEYIMVPLSLENFLA